MTDKNGRMALFGGKIYVWKESRVMTQGRKEVEVQKTMENNVIADKVLSLIDTSHILVLNSN